MAVETWTTGSTESSYTSVMGTEINSLASTNAVLGTVAINNSTNGDTHGTISISLGSVTSGAGAPYIGVYLYPLNQDASTYGDGRFGSSTTAVPPSNYLVGVIPVPASATGAIVGTTGIFPIAKLQYKVVLYNGAGVALAASSNTVAMQTYKFQVA